MRLCLIRLPIFTHFHSLNPSSLSPFAHSTLVCQSLSLIRPLAKKIILQHMIYGCRIPKFCITLKGAGQVNFKQILCTSLFRKSTEVPQTESIVRSSINSINTWCVHTIAWHPNAFHTETLERELWCQNKQSTGVPVWVSPDKLHKINVSVSCFSNSAWLTIIYMNWHDYVGPIIQPQKWSNPCT